MTTTINENLTTFATRIATEFNTVRDEIHAIPTIVESTDEALADSASNGVYWITGTTSSSGSTAQTLASNIDAINTLVENLDLLLALADAENTEITADEVDALFE